MSQEFQFFPEVDRDSNTGKIKSEFPIWYNPRMVQDMEDQVAIKEASIAQGAVPRGYEADFKEGLNRMKEQANRMKDMTMVDDAKNDRDAIKRLTDKLGKILKDEYPSQKECDRRIVDIQRENWKRFNPYLPVTDDEDMTAFVKACQVSISADGKVSRDGMEKAWKIGRKYIGEYANTEILRRA